MGTVYLFTAELAPQQDHDPDEIDRITDLLMDAFTEVQDFHDASVGASLVRGAVEIELTIEADSMREAVDEGIDRVLSAVKHAGLEIVATDDIFEGIHSAPIRNAGLVPA